MNEALVWCDGYITAFPDAVIGHQHKALIKSSHSQGSVRDALKSLDTACNLNLGRSPGREEEIVDFGLELSYTLLETDANGPACHETWLDRISPEPDAVVAANEQVHT